MATLLAHIRIKPGAEARFEELARSLFASTHENEPACRRYEYWRGAAPGAYYVLLSFDDFDGFMAHQVAPYHHDAGPTLNECFEDFTLEWVDPIERASPLVATEGTGGIERPDAGEVWNTYVRNHSEPMPPWWAEMRA